MFVTSHVLLQLLVGTLYHMSYIKCAELLPFGNSSIWIEDEELHKIKLSTPLEFFDKKYNEIYVSDDGVIAFDKDMKGKTNKPKSFPYEEKVIAPLWHDFDGAKVYFRTITPGTSPSDLKTASNLVKKTHPNREHFEAEWAVVFTWYNVSLTEEKNNTFQSLLVANENATFVIFLYGELQDAGEAQIGVNAGHCKIYYSLCISLTEKTTNMMDMRTCDGDYGVVGFRIDSADRDQAFYRCSPTYMYREERALQCECSSLDLPSSEIITEHNSTRVGGVLSYSCIEGYALIGDDELACYYNGSRAIWDGYEFGCIKLPQWVEPNQDDEYASVTVQETARGGHRVFKLQASTGDGTANISYSFVKQIPTNPNLFDLFGNEVRVMPDADLDVDDKEDKRSPAIYVLQFRAKDTRFSFTDRISRDAYLIVNIKDMNDNDPKFTKSLYTKRIEGSKKKGSYVLGVTALDKDASCPNNEVHYQIVDESLPGYFSLNPFDGKIRLVKQLNSTQYSMSVKATDGGYTGGYDAARVTIYVDNLVTTSTTTTKPVPEPVAMTTPASTGLSTAGVVGIIVAIGILMIVGILVFFYRRHLLMNQPSVSASFKHGKANVVLDDPNFIPNSSYIDDHSFSQPVPASSTNTTESATDYDSHCDTQVLTTDSWRKEKERVKMQSGQRKIDQ